MWRPVNTIFVCSDIIPQVSEYNAGKSLPVSNPAWRVPRDQGNKSAIKRLWLLRNTDTYLTASKAAGAAAKKHLPPEQTFTS